MLRLGKAYTGQDMHWARHALGKKGTDEPSYQVGGEGAQGASWVAWLQALLLPAPAAPVAAQWLQARLREAGSWSSRLHPAPCPLRGQPLPLVLRVGEYACQLTSSKASPVGRRTRRMGMPHMAQLFLIPSICAWSMRQAPLLHARFGGRPRARPMAQALPFFLTSPVCTFSCWGVSVG